MYIFNIFVFMKQKELIKGNLQTIIFRLLEENKEMYGYEIIQKTKEKTHHKINITEGALYPVLHKMEEKGWLSVSIKNIGNRKRKYYKLTEQGKKESIIHLEAMKDFINSLQLIFNPFFKIDLK